MSYPRTPLPRLARLLYVLLVLERLTSHLRGEAQIHLSLDRTKMCFRVPLTTLLALEFERLSTLHPLRLACRTLYPPEVILHRRVPIVFHARVRCSYPAVSSYCQSALHQYRRLGRSGACLRSNYTGYCASGQIGPQILRSSVLGRSRKCRYLACSDLADTDI